jgi:hypothetical protein
LDARKVQNLTGTEIWMFILGRVLVAFALEALGFKYFPQFVTIVAIPALLAGLVLLAIAARGLARQAPGQE